MKRKGQRGVDSNLVDLVYLYGRKKPQGAGRIQHIFAAKEQRKARRDGKSFPDLGGETLVVVTQRKRVLTVMWAADKKFKGLRRARK
jgi:hypothetical protein